jgi:hypothetical protein
MRQALLIAGAILVVALAANWVRRALMSDEARIRELLETMADGFNRSRTGDCLDGLAEDFREETTGVDKGSIGNFLRLLFLRERDPQTKKFTYRVELPEAELKIEVSAKQEGQARVDLVADFFKLAGEDWKLFWKARITADLEEGEDGWQVKRSRHETLEGRRKFY